MPAKHFETKFTSAWQFALYAAMIFIIGCTYATRGQNLLQYPIQKSNISYRHMVFSRNELFEQCMKPRPPSDASKPILTNLD
jgi:hypothetical protein